MDTQWTPVDFKEREQLYNYLILFSLRAAKIRDALDYLSIETKRAL
jgi:hypothetical protein